MLQTDNFPTSWGDDCNKLRDQLQLGKRANIVMRVPT
jgi:hypothetical protein